MPWWASKPRLPFPLRTNPRVKLLVTGGAGFLGRHVAAIALERGHEVVVLSRHPERARGVPSGAEIQEGDLTRPGPLAAALREIDPEAVVHAAAIVVDHDPKLNSVNIEGTAALCAALAGLQPAPRMVHVSTFSVEDVPPTDYSESKLAAEEVVRASGLSHVVLRPALIYGKGDKTNTPELVARMAHGTQWLPGGGRVLIQPVHVEDVALACVVAAERSKLVSRTYRLGGPEAVSVRHYREAVRDASGGQAAIRSLPLGLMNLAASVLSMLGKPRAKSVLSFHLMDHVVDTEEARQDLSYDPVSLDTGLKKTF